MKKPMIVLSVTAALAASAAPVLAEENGVAAKPTMREEMRGKLRKKRAERRKKDARPEAAEESTPAPASPSAPADAVSDEVSSSQIAPRARHFALLAHADEFPTPISGASSPTAETDERDRSLLDAVLGFEAEIETDDPKTRAGIEKAQAKSGRRPIPSTPEAESIEWESAPTSLE